MAGQFGQKKDQLIMTPWTVLLFATFETVVHDKRDAQY